MQRQNQRAILILIVFLTLGIFLVASQPNAAALQTPRVLNPFQPVTGNLDDNTLSQTWQFQAEAEQVVSLVAESTGNLDPVIELRDSLGNIVAANDNATFNDSGARLESVYLPYQDTYTVEVYREGKEFGITSGDYELTMLNGLSIPANTEALTRVIQLNSGLTTIERTLLDIPSRNFYTSLDFTVPAGNQAYQFEWRFHDSADFIWIFRHNTNKEWSLDIINTRGTIVRQTRGNSTALPQLDETAHLIFYLNDQVFTVQSNGETVTNLQITDILELSSFGQLNFTISTLDNTPNNETLIAQVRNLYLTTPFYESGQAAQIAIPPTPPSERIYQYNDAPLDAIGELRTLGYIDGVGGLQGTVNDGFVYSDSTGFTAFPLIERPFQNFVLGYSAVLFQGTPDTACGVIFRQINNGNFATVLNNAEQGLYFLQYEDGVAQNDQIALVTNLLRPDVGSENHFIIIANNGIGQLFVNGRLVGEIGLNIVDGTTSAHVVSSVETAAFCQINNLWLWTAEN